MSSVTQKIETKKPHLIMDFHFFPKVNITVASDVSREALESGKAFDLDYTCNVEVAQDSENTAHYIVTLKLETIPLDGKAYELQLEAVGGFHFTEECTDPNERGHKIFVMGQTMLYGACREYLALVTSRSPFPPVYLPSITFVPDDTEVGREEAEPTGAIDE